MYIVAIAWLYVALMIAITEPSVTGGVLSFLFYGLFPCALFLWLFGAPQRRSAAGTQCAPNKKRVSQIVPIPSPINSTCCIVAWISGRLCKPGIRSATATYIMLEAANPNT